MLSDAFFIARKDAKYMLRAKETILWVFVMPIVFFYFIGTVTGGFGGPPGTKETLAFKRGENAGFLADELIGRLEERGYRIVEPASDSLFVRYGRRITIPADFTDSLLARTPVTLDFTRTRGGVGFDYDSIRIKRAAYTVLADLIVATETTPPPSAETFETLGAMPRALTIHVTAAGQREAVPRGFDQAVPGIMVMFTLLVMTTSGAILLVIERRQGLLRRLAYTPINRQGVVIGKWGGKLFLGLVQIAFAMITGTLLFDIDWGPNFLTICVVMFAYGALMASVGIILGNLARTEGQAAAIGVISSIVLAALGGCWWPIEITPQWMQNLQLFLPTGWAMNALHKLANFAASPVTVLPHLMVMTGLACGLLVAAARMFRYE